MQGNLSNPNHQNDVLNEAKPIYNKNILPCFCLHYFSIIDNHILPKTNIKDYSPLKVEITLTIKTKNKEVKKKKFSKNRKLAIVGFCKR